jgi:hypothetical protein
VYISGGSSEEEWEDHKNKNSVTFKVIILDKTILNISTSPNN